MIVEKLYLATAAAAFLYVVSPGPAFLALFTLAASKGRAAGAWFIGGHLVGDVSWSALAFAAIVGVSRIGPLLFELLGAGCGLYLIHLGVKAVTTRKGAAPQTVGAHRPLLAGMAFTAFVTSVPLMVWEIATGGFIWPTAGGLLTLVYVALGPAFASQMFYMRGVELIGPGRAGVFVNLVPVFGAIMAVVLLGEPFATYHVVALVLVVGGIAIAQKGARPYAPSAR